MTQYLTIGGRQVPVRLLPNQRGIRLKWSSDGVLEIGAPAARIDERVQVFLHEKQAWILKYYASFAQRNTQLAEFWAHADRNQVLLEGQYQPLVLRESRSRNAKWLKPGLQISAHPSEIAQPRQLVLPAIAAIARPQLTLHCLAWSKRTGDAVEGVRVKNQSGKWGSCSSLRNINLNWRMILLPPELRDYVLVHELMHLREMNHSPRFWAEVGKYFPKCAQARTQLRAWEWTFGLDPAGNS